MTPQTNPDHAAPTSTPPCDSVHDHLRTLEARYRRAFEASLDGRLILDASTGTILDANAALADIFETSRDTLVDHTIWEVGFFGNLLPHEKDFRELTSLGTTHHMCLRLTTATGREIDVEFICQVYQENNRTCMQCSLRDVTDRRRLADDQLRTQQLRSLGHLAAGIAHNFNNLLCGVFGFIHLAKVNIDNHQPDEAQKDLVEALEAFDKTKELTRQLLTFAEGGSPRRVIVDLSSIILYASHCAVCNPAVSTTCDIDHDLWPCECDDDQITQVISNIILNGQQAMPEGGTLHISAKNVRITCETATPGQRAGSFVAISIRDHGTGIPKALLPRIYDPFFTTKPKGHGLGLAAAYSIVNRHHGWIDVDSTPNIGTAFHIYLPARPTATPPPHKNPPAQPKGRALIMDDQDFMREIVGTALAELGYEVTEARDGLQALTLFTKAHEENNGFAITVLDLTIPDGMGGEETVQAIKQIDKDALVLVVSGHEDHPVIENPGRYGFAGKLGKPFRREELMAVIGKIVGEAPN